MFAVDPPLANVEDMTIPRCAADADEAIGLVRECHAVWLEQKGPGVKFIRNRGVGAGPSGTRTAVVVLTRADGGRSFKRVYDIVP
jgi:hypothetical protein